MSERAQKATMEPLSRPSISKAQENVYVSPIMKHPAPSKPFIMDISEQRGGVVTEVWRET